MHAVNFGFVRDSRNLSFEQIPRECFWLEDSFFGSYIKYNKVLYNLLAVIVIILNLNRHAYPSCVFLFQLPVCDGTRPLLPRCHTDTSCTVPLLLLSHTYKFNY
jgi:hypothetical protein